MQKQTRFQNNQASNSEMYVFVTSSTGPRKAAHIDSTYKGELSQFTELANNMAFEDVGFTATSRQAILSGDFAESHLINAAHAIGIDARHHDKAQSKEQTLEYKLQKDQDRDIDL